MNPLEEILDGLEAELLLERELGVRVVECDRRLLTPLAAAPSAVAAKAEPAAERVQPVRAPSPVPSSSGPAPISEPVSRRNGVTGIGSGPAVDFVFLHERQLAPAGTEMMAKIVTALGKTLESAPIVHEGELPAAKVHVVLGSAALKKWFPGMRAAPGQWISCERAKNVLVTYSPTYILRFGSGSAAVQKVKREMWTSLKSVPARVSF